MRQSKSKRLFLYDWLPLVASNANLSEVGPERSGDGTEYVFPEEGLEKSLANKVVRLAL